MINKKTDMSNYIPVNTPLLNGNEKKYLNECIDSGWISSDGPFVKEFEEKFSKRVNRKYGISVCNGSVALDLAVIALGIGKGDEVIMPTFTIISCAAAIVRSGAIPIYVDSDPTSWNIEVNAIEQKISKKTKAIMAVHIYGLPVQMDKVIELAKKYNLLIIEDAAEMHGQKYNQKECGSFGDISCFSFYPNKHITTGEGGMIVTNDEYLANKCKSLRNLCFIPKRRFLHEELGWNYRFTNLQAAIGLAQLERLDEFIERKRHIGKMYLALLKDLVGIQLPLEKTIYAENIFWVFGLVLDKRIKQSAYNIMQKLEISGIGTRPFFYPMHSQPALKKYNKFNTSLYPVADNIAQNGFYLPSGLGLTDESIIFVANKLKEIIYESF